MNINFITLNTETLPHYAMLVFICDVYGREVGAQMQNISSASLHVVWMSRQSERVRMNEIIHSDKISVATETSQSRHRIQKRLDFYFPYTIFICRFLKGSYCLSILKIGPKIRSRYGLQLKCQCSAPDQSRCAAPPRPY